MGLLFKALIAAAWIWSLVLIDRIQRDKPVRERCLAIALFGWVPLGVSQSIAEGHNDIVMIAPALLWFLLLLRNNRWAPRRAGGVGAVQIRDRAVVPDRPDPRLPPRAAHGVCNMCGACCRRRCSASLFFALFFRSTAFFDGMRLVSEWYFLRPSEAVSGLEHLLGLPLYPLHVVALAVFPVIAVYWLAAAVREASTENLTRATVAMIAAIMFGAISHLWPWYLVWGVAFGALAPQWWVSRFITAVALLMPFTLATWWLPAVEPYRDIATLVDLCRRGAVGVVDARACRGRSGRFPRRGFSG